MINHLFAMKRLVVLSTGALMVMPMFFSSADVFAATGTQASTTKITQAQAQAIATRLLSIPSSYQMTQGMLQTDVTGQPAYFLNYAYPPTTSAVNGQQNWINVVINAKTGLIESYNTQAPNSAFVFPLPVSLAKATILAKQWAQKLYPNQVSQTQMEIPQTAQGALTGPTTYTFDFERMVHNIPAPFNGFSLQITSNGTLISVNDTWSAISFPLPKHVLSSSAVNALYVKALGLSLGYENVWQPGAQYIEKLGYQPSVSPAVNSWWNVPFSMNGPGYPVLDASTGALLGDQGVSSPVVRPTVPTPVKPGGPSVLPGSQKVNWSKDQALQAAQQMLSIDQTDRLESSSASHVQPSGDLQYTFTWAKVKGSASLTASATVDATDGMVLNANNFMTDPKNYKLDLFHPKISAVQAVQDAKQFVIMNFPQDTGALALVSNANAGAKGLAEVMYQLVPIVHGLPVSSGIGNITLNPVTGLVQSFYWNSSVPLTTLPTPAHAISLSLAQALWLQKYPMNLEYLLTQPQTGGDHASAHVVLVYASASPVNGTVLDALTQQFINTYNYQQTVPYVGRVKDIQGVTGATQLQFLANLGFLPVDQHGDVHPQQVMTRADFVQTLVNALGVSGMSTPLTTAMMKSMQDISTKSAAYPLIADAYGHGWLIPGQLFAPNRPATREFAALTIARALGFTALINKPALFQLSVHDAASLSGNVRRAAAIMLATGMMSPIHGNFDGTAGLTRSQAAVAIVQAAVVESVDSTVGLGAMQGNMPG